MISCKEAVGLNNKIGTCWNIAIQTNMFYGHNSEIIQKKLNDNSVDELLNPTVIENLERFLPPYLVDDNGKLLQASLDIIKKIVINLKKRFDIKNKQKVTKMKNTEEDVCEKDFVYYTFELIHPRKRNKDDLGDWGGSEIDSFFLTNILDIILLNKLTHIVKYTYEYLSNGNKISLNIDKIKNIRLYMYYNITGVPLDIKDLSTKSLNHACQFFECGGTTKYSNNDKIIEHDWRMFFKILNMLSVSDYEPQKNDSSLTIFSEYDKRPNPLPKYKIWENSLIGPYIVTYDSGLKPSIMYSFSPVFKVDKITNPSLIVAQCVLTEIHFSYNIDCKPENIKKLLGLNVNHYLSLDTMKNNILMVQSLLDLIDVNIIDKEKDTVIMKGIKYKNIIFVTEALKRINRTTLNYQDKTGRTALLMALIVRNIPLFKEIMKYNPDLTLQTITGIDVIEYARLVNIDLTDLITQEFKDLKTAIQNNNLHEVELLLDKLQYINETDSNGYTILMYAIKNTENLEIVKAILKKNPDLSINIPGEKKALDIAKEVNNTDMIKLLEEYISKPVNVKPALLRQVSSFDKKVKPVRPAIVEPIKEEVSKEFLNLTKAFVKNDLTQVESLLDIVKDINEYDSNGWTILMHTVMISDNIEIVKAILKKNPNLSIKTPTGQTALDFAKLFRKKDIIELLESYGSNPVHLKPKGRNEKCDIVDSLTVAKINEVFKEINQPIPGAKVLKAERLQILKGLLGC
jgi:ankyrin repeat protein